VARDLIEQLQPIMVRMRSRIEGDLSERDKAVIIDALVDSAMAGARVGCAQLAAYARTYGIELPESLIVDALRAQQLWPEES
jgi:hypothetical protein